MEEVIIRVLVGGGIWWKGVSSKCDELLSTGKRYRSWMTVCLRERLVLVRDKRFCLVGGSVSTGGTNVKQ